MLPISVHDYGVPTEHVEIEQLFREMNMVRASFFGFAFDLSDLTDRKRLAVKAAKRSDPHATDGKNIENDDERRPGYLDLEGVFSGVHLPS